MVVTVQDFLELRKQVEDRFGVSLHFHESCGSQYFSADQVMGQEVRNYLSSYFSERGTAVSFYGEDRLFDVRDSQED